MAMPHVDTRGKLNAGLMDFATTEALQDAQDAFGRSHTAEFDMCSTSDSLHNCLDPSILSIFENSSTGEEKNQIDEESEVTLLCALSDMLDNVIEDTLSPFDTLPNSELFMNQRSQDTKLRRIHTLAVCPSEKEAAPRATRSTRSSLSNGKVEALHSDRQLRPRLHRRTHAATIQRSDGEDEDLSETRRRPVRIFRIEPDPALCQEDHQDRFVRVALADLVRHMHPYSLRVALDKDSHRDVQKEEEDVYVDVEGDDEMGETLLTTGSWCDLDSEQAVPPSGSDANFKSVMGQSKEEMQNVFSDQNKNYDTAQKSQMCGRVRKSVSFAADLTTVHEFQPEHEHEYDMDGQDGEDLASNTVASSEFTEVAKTSKPRALSLQEYRLLRQKMLPKEERRFDHRTKWPSVPETPTELPPIRFISGHNPAQVNLQTSYPPGSTSKARRNLGLPLKMSPKRRKPVHHVDPPNPVTVPLKPPAPTDTKTSPPPSEEQHDTQQDVQGGHDAAQQASNVQEQPDSVRQEKKRDSPVKVVRSFPAAPVKANVSAPASPVKSEPVQTSQKNLAPVQTPANNESQCAEEQQESAAEIGIEATDVTSLLEQFETQGLTPPATPPHQIWKPLAPTLKAKQHEAKQSPVKTIQIIEPQPLPPSKLHSKPQLHSSIPAPSVTLAFMDHDYCRAQDFSNKKALSPVHMHDKSVKEPRNHASHKPLDNRTSCGEDRLSLSVLLSPESSPCRLEGSSVGEADDLEAPAIRGRTRRRCCRRKYRHSGSSSVSSSSSPSSCSSDSSSSRPRKRHRSRYSDSSSRSSSRSTSRSLSPSPIRDRRRRYRLSQSRSFSGSRSRSRSPLDWNRSWSRRRECYRQSRLEEARQKQKAIEERRVVYVGRIRGTMTKEELGERFKLFGPIEDCTVHFRSHGDNYGFVTYYNTDNAFAAIENGAKLRQPDELPFDICFGGRRQFCKSNYMDLDSSRDTDPLPVRSRDKEVDFDTLLKQAQRGRKM